MRNFTLFLFTACLTMAIIALTACSAPQTSPSVETTNDKTWYLQSSQSHINFTSIKKGDLAENHSFTNLSGTITADGTGKFIISLDSVQTNIDVRNERMRMYLFETPTHPNANITTQIDMGSFTDLAIGSRTTYPLNFNLNLHGVSRDIETEVNMTRLGADKIAVDSRTPILLDANDYGLESGLGKLAELAKLPPITPVVPVSFSIVLER